MDTNDVIVVLRMIDKIFVQWGRTSRRMIDSAFGDPFAPPFSKDFVESMYLPPDWRAFLEAEDSRLNKLTPNQIKLYRSMGASNFVGRMAITIISGLIHNEPDKASEYLRMDDYIREAGAFERKVMWTAQTLDDFRVVFKADFVVQPKEHPTLWVRYEVARPETNLGGLAKHAHQLRKTIALAYDAVGESYEEPELEHVGVGSFDFGVALQSSLVSFFLSLVLNKVISLMREAEEQRKALEQKESGEELSTQHFEIEASQEQSYKFEQGVVEVQQKLAVKMGCTASDLKPEQIDAIAGLMETVRADFSRGHEYRILMGESGEGPAPERLEASDAVSGDQDDE